MLLPTLLSTAALALTANAFLVPLEVADKAIDSKANNDFTATSFEESINLDCSTCPLALASARNGKHEWTTDAKSDLSMVFSTKDKDLSLNGVKFYPAAAQNMAPIPLHAKQIIKEVEPAEDVHTWDTFNGDLALSYSLELNEQKFKEDDASVVEIVLQVFGLDGELVNVDAVEIKAVKKSDGEIAIASLTTRPASITAEGEKCTTIWCRMISMIKAKMQAAGHKISKTAHKIKAGCMRKFGSHPRPAHKGPKIHGGKPKFADRPHGKPHHHGHNHHHKGSKIMHTMKSVAKHVLLPVFIGIAAGMLVSAIGMLVGQVIVFFWIRHRRNQRGPAYERVEQLEKEDGDLPAYEEVQGEEAHLLEEKTETV